MIFLLVFQKRHAKIKSKTLNSEERRQMFENTGNLFNTPEDEENLKGLKTTKPKKIKESEKGKFIKNSLIFEWNSLFITRKVELTPKLDKFLIKEIHKNLESFSIREIRIALFSFYNMCRSRDYIFMRLPEEFTSFSGFIKVKQSLLKKLKKTYNITEEMKSDFNFNSDSFLMDCLCGDTEKFITSSLYFIFLNQEYSPVGSYGWLYKRISEVIGQTFSLYCSEYDKMTYNTLLPSLEYLKVLQKVTPKFISFLENYNKHINVWYDRGHYFYILERPYFLIPVLYDFLEENYQDKTFMLNWIGGSVFNNMFRDYLEKKRMIFVEKQYGRFSRGVYRQLAKQSGTIFSGDVKDTKEFQNFLNEQE